MLLEFIEKKKLLPKVSDTERAALEAGTVWLDGVIFSGTLRWDRLMEEAWPSLSEREQAFLDGPVETLCRQLDDWAITKSGEIPQSVWDYLKANGFFGLLIPEVHGGLGFSTLGASAVFGKLASCSFVVASVVLIPNSVGPAELLLHYGTPEQQTHYLPRLARGEEIPCFALTEPEAGSDAASIRSRGVVFRRADGTLWLRLSWNKRYITLAPKATLLGLACRLEDPDNLLGQGPAPGITCVLVPVDTPGVEIGRRHDPMGLALPNGPTTGTDVEVPVDQIIGGASGAGRGWRMLMECLAAGRAVSLPGNSAGAAKQMVRMAGAYAAIRRQFGVPIGRFEGIEAPLARMGGFAYMMEAARVFTCGAIDRGARPAVVASLMKYFETELSRQLTMDAMDVLGGAALCRGPKNPLSNALAGAAIGITVEGANILTRTLIMFGQGAIRCHPYAGAELQAMQQRDAQALARSLQSHLRFVAGNVWHCIRYYFTRGPWAEGPCSASVAGYFRRLAWATAQFAVLADLMLFTLGPRLKQKGHLSGRMADLLCWIFVGLATLRRFEGEDRPPQDVPLVQWSLEYCLLQAQRAVEGVWQNFPVPGIGPVLGLISRINRLGAGPEDRLTKAVAELVRTPGPARDRLTAGVWRGGRAAELDAALEAEGPEGERLRRQAIEVDDF